jgi:hypothetical protein
VHLEHQRWRPGPARSRPVPDRAAQRSEHRGGVQSSLHPKPADFHKQVPNRLLQMTLSSITGNSPEIITEIPHL